MSLPPDTQASDRFGIEVPIDAPLRGVIDTEQDFLGVVGEVGRSVTDRAGEPVRWLLTHAQTNGVIRLQLRGVPVSDLVPDADVPRIVDAVAGGLTIVEHEAERPLYFTDRALEHAQDMAERSVQLGSIRVIHGGSGTLLTPTGAGEHVQHLLGSKYSDYGSVEGRLEGINVHAGDRYFNVYDALTDRRVRCFFGNRIPLRRIADALERRVAVYGTVNYRASGEVNTVAADDIDPFPPDSELPTFDDVRGILG